MHKIKVEQNMLHHACLNQDINYDTMKTILNIISNHYKTFYFKADTSIFGYTPLHEAICRKLDIKSNRVVGCPVELLEVCNKSNKTFYDMAHENNHCDNTINTKIKKIINDLNNKELSI